MIVVSSLRHIDHCVAKYNPTRSLSLLAPWQTIIFEADNLPAERVILGFNDIAAPEPDRVPPSAETVAAILDFGRACRTDEVALVHCWMGVSRSPAAAYIIACERHPDEEHALAEALRRLSPAATPNRLLIALADEMLARGGRMVAAIDAIGRGREVDGDTPPFEWPL